MREGESVCVCMKGRESEYFCVKKKGMSEYLCVKMRVCVVCSVLVESSY